MVKVVVRAGGVCCDNFFCSWLAISLDLLNNHLFSALMVRPPSEPKQEKLDHVHVHVEDDRT